MTVRDHAATPMPEIVSSDEWWQQRETLLAHEKEHTRAADALAAERRRMPMVRIDGEWQLEGMDGPASLLDLFDGRRQLVLYHHMLKANDESPCGGCSWWGDGIGNLAHLNALDITLALISVAPIDQVAAYRRRMGWTVPFYSSAGTTFDDDLNPTPGMFGCSVFLRDGDDVYRTYFTTHRGAEKLVFGATIADITPYGRQESFEDSPSGWPQMPTYSGGALHDEYTAEQLSGATAPSSTGHTVPA